MGLHEFQNTLLRLYTDPVLLHAFMHEPEKTLDPISLTDREKNAILALPRERLKKWQRELQFKRKNVSERVLTRSRNNIMLLSFYQDGPALAWGKPPRTRFLTITPGMYWLLHAIGRTAQPLSLSTLIQASTTVPSWTLSDMFRISKFMYTQACVGKNIMVA